MVRKRERHSKALVCRLTHGVDYNWVRANKACVIEFSESAQLLLSAYFEDRTSLANQFSGWLCRNLRVAQSRCFRQAVLTWRPW